MSAGMSHDTGGIANAPDIHNNMQHAEPTVMNKTGIIVENLPAKSAVSVSVDANDAGEYLPLVYVLVCQKVA
jgi:hypothetical protein